jgi:acid phosphatase
MEENHAFNEIIGNANAPYINSLANGGALLTNYHAVTHPSEPNYFALYAGSTFGVADDANYSEPDPTLATVLQAAGKTFTGFIETAAPASPRKHNPWESFPEGTTVEKSFTTQFPTDFDTLPDVSFVIPNQNHDMHDGTIAAADSWLQTSLDAYAQWAVTHHSLLMVLWDEDDSSAGNQIPGILYGANISPGTYNASYNHYDILASITGSFSLTAPNSGATAAGLDGGIFKVSPTRWSASVDLGAHPAGWVPEASGDFNHDGTSDVLWYNSTTNQAEIWVLSNGQWSASTNLGSHPAGWQVAAAGDFSGDGTSDVLWFNSATGDAEVWKVANGQWAGSFDIGHHPAGWVPAGVGDFNRDGTSDILWFNPATGGAEIWKVANGQWAGNIDLGKHPAGWQPAGVGDFNHDGSSDILWFNPTTSAVELWLMENGQWSSSVTLGSHPAGWQPAGVGDFNRDGTSDILWFNPTTNNSEIWQIRDAQWAGGVNLGSHPAGWTISGVGDFNHDGATDIQWRETATGHVEEWLLTAS